jgi:phenylalanyl-tRNA synthetase beta chain
MKFSFDWIKEYIDTDLLAKELAELLTLHSFETEITKEGEVDIVFDIDILPNRFSDSASHFGIAREVAVLQKALENKNPKLNEPEKEIKEDVMGDYVKIEEGSGCLRYSCAVVEGVKVEASPKWLKDRLALCGVGSINNIVDITNFVMLELGQPIHAFDFNKISDGEIIVRKAKEGEKINLLDDRELTLDQEDLVIADNKKVLALAGIKGGKGAELDKNTKTILIESAYFDKTSTYVTSKKYRLQTDASRRFSAGGNSELPPKALFRAIYLIRKIGEGDIVGVCDKNLTEKSYKKIKLNINNINDLIGISLTIEDAKKLLEAVDCKVETSDEEMIVIPPFFRPDLEIKENLIEEISRLYGYENIESTLPYLPLCSVDHQLEGVHKEKLKDLLRGAGFFEIYTYSFLSERVIKILELENSNPVRLKNPISERFSLLRPSLLPGILTNLKRNTKHDKEIRVFEIGKIFKNIKGEVFEEDQIAIAMTLPGDPLFELKGVGDLFLKNFGIKNYFIEAYSGNFAGNVFNKKTLAQIKVGEEIVGHIGNVSTKTLAEFKIGSPSAIMIISAKKLLELAKGENKYEHISKYPTVSRDLAILINRENNFSEVTKVIEDSGAKFIQDIDLFDVYEGKNLPKNKKSLALHIMYQSSDHTLEDKEVNAEHKKIEEALIKKLNAVIR